MGVVLKGYDTELHRVVAIKVLLPHLASSGAARRRFAREAQAAAAVMHEHVIPIHDVEVEGEIPYIVMQYVPGQSLQARVDEQGPLRVPEILRLARQALGMNRREFVRISGVSSTAISHVEEGKGQPRTDTIEKLAIALKVSPAWLGFVQGERDQP